MAVLPLFLLPARRVGGILRTIRRQALQYNADMSSTISETLGINGVLLVKTFGRQRQEMARFRETSQKVRDIGVRRALVGRWFVLGLGIASAIGTALIYWVGGYQVLEGTITVGTIVAFSAYLTRLYGPISSLSNVQVEFAQSMVSFERVFEYLDLPVEIEDRPGAVELERVDGHVRFEHVSFSYLAEERELAGASQRPSQDETLPRPSRKKAAGRVSQRRARWALRDLSFEIPPGRLAALVGPSGGGKTTRHLSAAPPLRSNRRPHHPRRPRPARREPGVAGPADRHGHPGDLPVPRHGAGQPALRQPRRHPGRAGIRLPGGQHPRFHRRAARGYDTLVGERGYRLSGGEKQRLAIARVILKDPCLLVLDEATSHLDSHSEALIQAALEPLLVGRTSLVIAHRLSTILAADQILVLDEGRLVEQGTHGELLARGGLYAHLYETQFGLQRQPCRQPILAGAQQDSAFAETFTTKTQRH